MKTANIEKSPSVFWRYPIRIELVLKPAASTYSYAPSPAKGGICTVNFPQFLAIMQSPEIIKSHFLRSDTYLRQIRI